MVSSHLYCPPYNRSPSRTAAQKSVRRGAAAVEFALVAPLLFMLFFGIVDVGRAIMVKNLLTSAARDGARQATLDGSSVAGVRSQVTSYLADATITGVTVTVSPSPLDTAQIGDPVSVTVTVPFSSVSWLPSSFYLGGVTLDSTVVMRRETN